MKFCRCYWGLILIILFSNCSSGKYLENRVASGKFVKGTATVDVLDSLHRTDTRLVLYKGDTLVRQTFVYYEQTQSYTVLSRDKQNNRLKPYYARYYSGNIAQVGSIAEVSGYLVAHVDSISVGARLKKRTDTQLVSVGKWQCYYPDGKLKASGHFRDYYNAYEHERSKVDDNFMVMTTFYSVKNNKFRYYNESGELSRIETWRNGNLKRIKYPPAQQP